MKKQQLTEADLLLASELAVSGMYNQEFLERIKTAHERRAVKLQISSVSVVSGTSFAIGLPRLVIMTV